jgi:hypothetical protein
MEKISISQFKKEVLPTFVSRPPLSWIRGYIPIFSGIRFFGLNLRNFQKGVLFTFAQSTKRVKIYKKRKEKGVEVLSPFPNIKHANKNGHNWHSPLGDRGTYAGFVSLQRRAETTENYWGQNLMKFHKLSEHIPHDFPEPCFRYLTFYFFACDFMGQFVSFSTVCREKQGAASHSRSCLVIATILYSVRWVKILHVCLYVSMET